MIDLKKKCWREKVIAEVTVAHVLEFAGEVGATIDAAQVTAFLNEKGHAQDIWTHMMQAAEDYIKTALSSKNRTPAPRNLQVRQPGSTRASYQ